MPRYYCDYCDTHLTHDSPSVRKQHNAGYKHKANVREYYQQFEQLQTQSLIDQKIKEHLGQAGMYQIGAAYNQHLASLPPGMQRPRLPILPPPVLPVPGSIPMMPGFRPPMLPPRPGYGMPPQMAPIPGQPPQIASSLPMQANGMARPPPTMSAPDGPTGSTSAAPPGITQQAMYQNNPPGGLPPPPPAASTDSYGYAPASGAGH